MKLYFRMFGCCVKKHDAVDLIIPPSKKPEPVVEKKIYRILLLGPGESGKSTILKQMKIIHLKGFTETEIQGYIDIVRTNLLVILKSLFSGVERLNLSITMQENLNFKAIISKVVEGESGAVMQSNTSVEAIKKLLTDPSVQEAIRRGSEFNLYDSATYFLSRVDDICSPQYIPNTDDILHARTKTVGIVETSISVGKNEVIYVDIAGQRSERRKWIHIFDNAHAILFVAAISEYDQVLAEDEKMNRVKEAVELLDKVCNSRWFLRTSIILFLNKCDIFKTKIAYSPIEKTFPEYKGGPDFDAGRRYFRGLFLSAVEAGRDIYTHFTSATDTKACSFVLESVHNSILNNTLDKMVTLA